MKPLDVDHQEPDEDNVCPDCGHYWDTPNHFYGCPIAADELARFTEELGLPE